MKITDLVMDLCYHRVLRRSAGQSRGRLRSSANVAAVVGGVYTDGRLVDAVHDVNLQRVQVRQDLVALGTGVFGNVSLLPVST